MHIKYAHHLSNLIPDLPIDRRKNLMTGRWWVLRIVSSCLLYVVVVYCTIDEMGVEVENVKCDVAIKLYLILW